MKKITLLFLFVIFSINTPVQALSWAYPFVVWKGDVYEVKEEKVPESQIGKEIGQVKRQADDMTGEYYGDASNYYPKGTKYYEIEGTPAKSAIAVEVKENQWVKAIYLHQAPFHWMDFVTTAFPILILLAVIISIVLRVQNAKLRK